MPLADRAWRSIAYNTRPITPQVDGTPCIRELAVHTVRQETSARKDRRLGNEVRLVFPTPDRGAHHSRGDSIGHLAEDGCATGHTDFQTVGREPRVARRRY